MVGDLEHHGQAISPQMPTFYLVWKAVSLRKGTGEGVLCPPQKQLRGWLGLPRNGEEQQWVTGLGALRMLLSAASSWVEVSWEGCVDFKTE